MDIEGQEADLLSSWLNRTRGGVLARTLQLGFEFHRVTERHRAFFRLLRGLYRLGFLLVSWEPNWLMGKRWGCEVVFRRPSPTRACRMDWPEE